MKRDPVRLVDGGGRGLGGDGATASLAVARVARDLQVARRAPHGYDADAGLRRFSATLAGVGVAAGGLVEGGLGSSAAPGLGSSVSASVSSAASVSTPAASAALGPATGAGAAVPLAGGAVSTVAAAPAFLAVKVLVVSMVAAGSVTTAVVVARGPSEPHVAPVVTSSPSSPAIAPPPSEPASTAPAVEVAPAPVASDEVVAAEVDPAPSPSIRRAPVASDVAVAPAASPAPPGAASPVKLETEHLALVRQAGDPASALARAEEGHARFPRGVFWQERESIAIASLVRLGREGEARSRARTFLERHPESPYAPTLRRIAGGT